jgi:hypothetical protein
MPVTIAVPPFVPTPEVPVVPEVVPAPAVPLVPPPEELVSPPVPAVDDEPLVVVVDPGVLLQATTHAKATERQRAALIRPLCGNRETPQRFVFSLSRSCQPSGAAIWR